MSIIDSTRVFPAGAAQPAAVLLVIPYLGTLPEWLPGYMRLASFSSQFCWLLLTDDDDAPSSTDNFHVVRTTREKLEKRFSDVLQIPISLGYAYKLCDYRPAFGLIFEDEFSNFPYWGYTDLDTVIGDLDSYFANAVLGRADTFSCSDYQTGHLSIYRNRADINLLFRQDPDFELIFRDYENYCGFDEKGFELVLRRAESRHEVVRLNRRIFADAGSDKNWRSSYERDVCQLPPGPLWIHSSAVWTNGKVIATDGDKEVAYHHFSRWSDSLWSAKFPEADSFVINRLSFYPTDISNIQRLLLLALPWLRWRVLLLLSRLRIFLGRHS